MQELIERLEKATGPDRALDYDIQCEVNGAGEPPPYTVSIDAALTLVPEPFSGSVTFNDQPHHCATVFIEHEPVEGCGFNSAIALCIAALKARSQT